MGKDSKIAASIVARDSSLVNRESISSCGNKLSGSVKRSLAMAIPKACGFEAATRRHPKR